MEGGIGFESLCRICTNKSEGISIFSKEGKEIDLEEKIKKFLYITVSEEDVLPKTVCTICTSKLDGIHEFARMASLTQIKLVEMMGSGESPPSPPEDEGTDDSVKGSLLHSILTKEKNEPDVTELEVTVDPMLFLADQEDEEFEKNSPEPDSSSRSESNSEEDNSSAQLIEGKPYQCTVCPRGFNSDLSLKNHLWGHLSMRKILASSDLNLNRFHVETKHRVYSTQCLCTVCGRVYPTRSTLRAHQITHSNLRPHKCSLCEKTFKRNQDLKFHINQHTGERPYRCPYCPKAFASSGNCFSHRKRMHPKQLARDKKAAARQFHL